MRACLSSLAAVAVVRSVIVGLLLFGSQAAALAQFAAMVPPLQMVPPYGMPVAGAYGWNGLNPALAMPPFAMAPPLNAGWGGTAFSFNVGYGYGHPRFGRYGYSRFGYGGLAAGPYGLYGYGPSGYGMYDPFVSSVNPQLLYLQQATQTQLIYQAQVNGITAQIQQAQQRLQQLNDTKQYIFSRYLLMNAADKQKFRETLGDYMRNLPADQLAAWNAEPVVQAIVNDR